MADCESCKNYDRPTICSTCENGSDFEGMIFTNADRIRSMNDEELAEFLNEINRTCIVDALNGNTMCDNKEVNCAECKFKFGGIDKWLQSEAK